MTEGFDPKSLITTVFVPSAIFGIGQGAGAPVVALLARELGASVPVAGVVVALVALGAVIGDLPAGSIVARLGERRAILAGTALGTVGVLVSLTAWTPAVLAAGAVLTGFANAVWGLARQSYLAEAVPIERRARAMAAFATMWRLGFFLGPFAVGAVATLSLAAGALTVGGLALLGAACMFRFVPRYSPWPRRTLEQVAPAEPALHNITSTLGHVCVSDCSSPKVGDWTSSASTPPTSGR